VCFSTEVSAGVAVALLPVGGYCLAVAVVKDRAYLPLAALPLLFGVQQVFEGAVWASLGQGDPGLSRNAGAGFLLIALGIFPVWVPLAAAVLEGPGPRRAVFLGFAAAGLATAAVYALPVATGETTTPTAAGHALRYDLPDPGPVWPAVYLAAVCVPLVSSRVRRVRPLGWLVLAAAVAAYAATPDGFASAMGCLAAPLSGYVAYVLFLLPADAPTELGTGVATPAA
jgi:hypothetical protein